ncbi:MAG: NYN domain-containing protein [Gemmatimonadetes bacterium]|nr:MAG: NYN domain-containing protein [Gemmatimonadota bacterium]
MNQQRHRVGVTPAAAAHAPNAALLIDFDNVTLGIRSDLTKELRTLLDSDIIKGKVAVQRAYADWRRYPQYIVPLSESSIDLIFAPAFGTNKKNATDIRLAIDAIELVFTRPEIGTFILLSGDSDFSTMVIKLKEYGKYVIGVGLRDSASDLLIQNCDEYYSYSDLAGLTKDERDTIQRDPWELVQEAVARMGVQGDVMRSDRLKQVMQQIDPNFEERNAGFNRFSRFITEAATRGLLVCTKLENGQYQVAPVGDAAPTPPAAAEKRSRRVAAPAPARAAAAAPAERRTRKGRTRGARGGGERTDRTERTERPKRAPRAQSPASQGRGQLTLAKAFSLMSEALQQLERPVDHETLRLRMVTIHGKEDGLLEAARFQRLLRQANDAEVADVKKVGEGSYEVDLTAVAAEVHKAVELSAAQARKEAADAGKGKPQREASAVNTPTDGRRRTMRHRRGSRAPVTAGGAPDIPMVGVVRLDSEPATKAKKAAKKSSARKKPAVKKAAKPGAGTTQKKTVAKKAVKKKAAKSRSGANRTRKATQPAASKA